MRPNSIDIILRNTKIPIKELTPLSLMSLKFDAI